MESLSGHLHSRKLSNGNTGFSTKNPYDGLFSGQKKFGAPNFTPMEDYREIFGSSASSVPVLDLSGFDDPNGSRSSKPDYSKIFGGFPDDDDGAAVFYEELFGGVKAVKNSPEKARRATSTRRQPSQDSEDLFDASNQSADALKQYNTSYHKTTQRSKDGSNGTTHVAKLHDVPGFTTFIDEIKMSSSQKENETQKSLAINGRPEVKNSKKALKQTSGSAVKSKSGYSRGGSFSDDKLFNACDIGVKSYPSKIPSPSFMLPYSENHQARSNGPVASNSRAPEIDVSESDEELDVNSAAAASVAALKKAIEKAQESIRMAKESVGRKKEGLQSFSNKSFKDSLKVKGHEATDKKADGVDAASEVFDLMGRKNACNGGVAGPDFKDGENLFVARKVINEIHGKISESARQHERSPWSAPELNESEKVSVSREVGDETGRRNQESVEKSCELEVRTTHEILEEQGFIKKSDAVENSCEVEDKVRKPDAEVRLNGLESASLVDKGTENGLPSSKQEEQKVVEKPQGFYKLVNFVKNLGGFVEIMEDDKKVSDEVKDDDYKVRVNEVHNSDENKMNDSQVMIENEQNDRDYEERHDQTPEQFEIGEEQVEVLEKKSIENSENENRLGKDCDYDLNEKISEEGSQRVENELKNSDIRNETEKKDKDCDHDVNEKFSKEVSQCVENELKKSDIRNEMEKEDNHKEEAIEKWLEEVHEMEINATGPTFVHNLEESEVRLQDDSQKGKETELSEEKDANDEKDSEETLKEKCDWAGDDDVVTEDYIYKGRESTASGTDGNEEIKEREIPQKVDYEEIFGRDFDGFNHDNNVEIDDNIVELDVNNVETGQEANDSEFKEEKAEAVEVSNRVQEDEISEAGGRSSTEDDAREFEVKEVHVAFSCNEHEGKYGLGEKEVGVNEIGQTDRQLDFVADSTETVSNETIEVEELIKEEVKSAFPQEERKLFPKRAHWDLEGSRLPSISKEEEQTVEIKDEYKRSQYNGKTENLSRTMEDKKDKETEVKRVEEKKRLKELDEATKRQREEREKERMAVERVIREARERAYAEIRENAERAAVEKATAEVRQRVMAEAREKFEKVSEKASIEAKIRAQRAAVERANAEAWERALEKAMSQKTTTSERFVAEKFSGASRDTGYRQSSSADLHGSSGTNSESAQRSKAKLESHNRIMQRAAKALAEKEKRDLLAQREQAERNRLAETLDAEVKRWSSGKEGNLRALLSTLQYILGSNSGWQPVSLTEIITTNAVKKAYRKATLVVHPDKLQQRGATIQQKYICEKVFDLLKAAWSRFNSEER